MQITFAKPPIKIIQTLEGAVLYNPLNHEVLFNAPSDFSSLTPNDPLLEKTVEIETPKLKKVRVEMGLECNAGCSYCVVFKNDLPKKKISMDMRTADDVIQFFNSNVKGGTLMILGGEPLLNWRVAQHLIEGCDASDKTIFTNATLVNEEQAEFLADKNVLVLVSLDGMERHNINRVYHDRRPMFQDTITGLRKLQSAGARVAISTVVTSANVKDLADIVRFYDQDISIKRIGLTTPHHIAHGKIEFDTEAYTFQMIEIFSYMKEHSIYVDQIAKRLGPIVNQTFKYKGCKIHGEQVTFYPDGSKSLCIKLDMMPLASREAGYFFGRLPIFDDNCRDNCEAIGICGGGCYLDAFYDPTGRDQRDCRFFGKMLELILGDMRDIANPQGRVLKTARLAKYGELLNEH